MSREDAHVAYGYVRLSQESDTSIENQMEAIREYADDQGLDLKDIFNDGQHASGYDNTDEKRPEYLKLKTLIEDGQLDAVVVNDRTRLGRDYDELVEVISLFRRNGIEWHTARDGHIDISEPTLAAIECIKAAQAHEAKMEEIKKAIEEIEKRMDDPDTYHGRPPAGLTFDDDKRGLVVDENAREEYEKAMKVIRLRRDEELTYSALIDRTGLAKSRISRILNRQLTWFLTAQMNDVEQSLDTPDPEEFLQQNQTAEEL